MEDKAPLEHVVVHGVGLIGGSVAAAVRQAVPECRITGIGRSESRLQAAQAKGLLDDWATSTAAVDVGPAVVIVICLPVDLIPSAVISAANVVTERVLITDAGSTKQQIQNQINLNPTASKCYVGAHPIAGSEQTGFERADADLFRGRPCIVVRSPEIPALERRCCRFWELLGADVSVLDASEHDRILSLTSHLPHVMAAMTALCVEPTELKFTGSGFADTSRVAAGDPMLWRQILCQNRAEVLAGLETARERLDEMIDALQRHDDVAVELQLQMAAEIRRQIR